MATIMLNEPYHPPYSLTSKSTNAQFINQYITYIREILPLFNNLILMGDINLHLSKEDNTDATIFEDSLEALGLYQNVSFSTHRSGNTLNLAKSKVSEKINIMTIVQSSQHLILRRIDQLLRLEKFEKFTMSQHTNGKVNITQIMWILQLILKI